MHISITKTHLRYISLPLSSSSPSFSLYFAYEPISPSISFLPLPLMPIIAVPSCLLPPSSSNALFSMFPFPPSLLALFHVFSLFVPLHISISPLIHVYFSFPFLPKHYSRFTPSSHFFFILSSITHFYTFCYSFFIFFPSSSIGVHNSCSFSFTFLISISLPDLYFSFLPSLSSPFHTWLLPLRLSTSTLPLPINISPLINRLFHRESFVN